MNAVLDLLAAAMLVVAGVFGLVGSWALLRLPDVMMRLHGPTKSTTLGVGGVLIASMIHFWRADKPIGHELLITGFLLLTAPITAQFIAKSVIFRNLRPRDLPPTGTGQPWATHAVGADTGAAELNEVPKPR